MCGNTDPSCPQKRVPGILTQELKAPLSSHSQASARHPSAQAYIKTFHSYWQVKFVFYNQGTHTHTQNKKEKAGLTFSDGTDVNRLRGMKSPKETLAKPHLNVFLICNNARIQDNYEFGLFSVHADSFHSRVITEYFLPFQLAWSPSPHCR